MGVNRETGEDIRRPGTSYIFDAGGRAVTLTPDPGWSYPGRTGAPFGPITGDPTKMSPLIGGQTNAAELGLPLLPAVPRGRPRRPKASSVEQAEDWIRDAIGAVGGRVLTLDENRSQLALATVPTPVGEVVLTRDFVYHVAYRRGEAREQFADYILPTLRNPAEVWLSAADDNGRLRYMLAYIGDGAQCVAQEHRDGTVGWTFYPARRVGGQRAGYLLYRRAN